MEAATRYGDTGGDGRLTSRYRVHTEESHQGTQKYYVRHKGQQV